MATTDNVIPHPATAHDTVNVPAEKLQDLLDLSALEGMLNGLSDQVHEMFSAVRIILKESAAPGGMSSRARDHWELDLYRMRHLLQEDINSIRNCAEDIHDTVGALLLHPKAEGREEVAAE